MADVDEETASVDAEVREAPRLAGSPVPENDVWIAALTRQHGPAIVSRDRRFDRIEGSSVSNGDGLAAAGRLPGVVADGSPE